MVDGSAGAVNDVSVKMIGAAARRKVRCPKCTALFNESATSIFQCPICSAFLRGDSNGGVLENRVREHGRDADTFKESSLYLLPTKERQGDSDTINESSLHLLPTKERQGESNERSSENRPHGNMRDVERTEQTLEGDSKQEYYTVTSEPSETQGQQGKDDKEEESTSFVGYNGLFTPSTGAFASNIDAPSSEMSLYASPPSIQSDSPDRSGDSSDGSSCDESENDFGFPALLSEKDTVVELPEIVPFVGLGKGFHLEQRIDRHVPPAMPDQKERPDCEIGDDVGIQQEVIGPIVGHHVELSSQEETGKEIFDASGERSLDCDMVHSNEDEKNVTNESFLGLKHSLIEQDSLEMADCSHNDRSQSSLTESSIENESSGDLGYQNSDVHPLVLADDERFQSSLKELSVSTACEHFSEGTNIQEKHGNGMTLEASGLQDADFGHSVFSDVDENRDDLNQASSVPPSILTHQVRDSNSEADLRYADVWTKELVSTEVLDLSLGDWQSLQVTKSQEDSKGISRALHWIDEKRSVSFKMAAQVGSSSKDGEDVTSSATFPEHAKLKQSPLMEISADQEEALSGMKTANSCSAILITENEPQIEKPAFPLRTAAMQKFLLRPQVEVQAEVQPIDSESNSYERAYLGECQPGDPLATEDKIHHLNMGSPVSEQVSSSDAHLLPASKLKAKNVELAPSSETEKLVTVRHSHVTEDVHERHFNIDQCQEFNEGAFTERPTMSAYGPGELSGNFHHLNGSIVTRLQVNDHEEGLPDVAADLFAAGMNRNRKGIPAQQRQPLNSDAVTRLDPVHGYKQEHYNFLQSQKFGRDRNLVNCCSECGNAVCICGPYARRPRVHPAKPVQELASSHCLHHCVCSMCTFYMQHPHLQQPHVLQSMMYPDCAVNFPESMLLTHQQVLPESAVSFGAHHMSPSLHANASAGLFRTGYFPSQCQTLKRSYHPLNNLDGLTRKQKHYPPLPWRGSPPYVLCQGCHDLLQVPAILPCNAGNVQKLRCGVCRKVSKFSVYRQPNNSLLMKRSLSSSVDAAMNTMARITIAPHPVQSSTAFKLHPETAMAYPRGESSSFLSSQSMDYLGNRVLNGETKFGSDLHARHELGENRMSMQANDFAGPVSITESSDHTFHPMPVRGVIQGQGLFGSPSTYAEDDGFPNSSRTYGDSYFSSLPSSASGSSPLRNVSNHSRNENHMAEIFRKEREIFGGREMKSTMNVQDGPAFGASSISHDYFQKDSVDSIKIISPPSIQVSLQEHKSESSPVESLKRGKPQQQRSMGSDDSRSSSTSSTPRVRKSPAAPGSPLFEHITAESTDFGSSLQQRGSLQVSGDGIRSAPWSPAQGSPLSDHVTSLHFNGRPRHKAQGSRVHEESTQEVSGPRYFAGLLKKSLRDLGKGGQGNNKLQKVMINGQLVSDVAVKKAEARAGIIRPGSYWYDYKAGFWGISGGPCIGIIPPFIEELKFPLAKDCSGGMTGVTVNGRELHQKDLEVLSRRGLPTTPGKTYIIDITGQVVDGDSGQCLSSLGKLAPTIERKGQGNGMFQPKNVPN